MKTYYLTFGYNSALRRSYAEIRAENYESARAQAFAHHGSEWAFLYDSPEEAGVFRFGLEEVPLGTPNYALGPSDYYDHVVRVDSDD